MSRLPAIACLFAMMFVTATACAANQVRHPARRDHPAAAQSGHRRTGWIPPGHALPANAGPAAAPNLVYLDTIGTFADNSSIGEQSLAIYRIRSFSDTLTAANAFLDPPSCCNFVFVNAADDDRTFLVSASAPGNETTFYELRLSQRGKPLPLIPLSMSVPGRVLQNHIALTPDGREIAVVTSRGRNGPYRISVVATSTGRMRTRTWRGSLPEFLSWSGDNNIDFIASSNQKNELVRLNMSAPAETSAFRVLAAGFGRFGSLAKWSPWRMDGLTITADGRTAFVPITGGGDWSPGPAPRIALLRLSATTGRTLQVVAKPWAVPEGNS
ncbi:MAG TPA: hypothetical protein VF506_05825, partial [Streptosporangiaceae bacterium]